MGPRFGSGMTSPAYNAGLKFVAIVVLRQGVGPELWLREGLLMVTTLGGLECESVLHGQFHRWCKSIGLAGCMPGKEGWLWWEGKGTEACVI